MKERERRETRDESATDQNKRQGKANHKVVKSKLEPVKAAKANPG